MPSVGLKLSQPWLPAALIILTQSIICIPKPEYFISALHRQNQHRFGKSTPKITPKPKLTRQPPSYTLHRFLVIMSLFPAKIAYPKKNRGTLTAMLLLIATLLAIGLILLALALQKQSNRLRQIAQGLLVSYGTIIVMLMLGEAYFRFFHAESTSFLSLSVRNWRERYEHLNSEGYRDHEWQSEDFAGRTVIFAIGDSFTQGHGINNPEDRWSNVLASLLGEDYAVVNLGISGSATRQQMEAAQNFTLATPNVIIWQYFLNDIEFAAAQNGSLPPSITPPEIAQESYMLNYLWFRTAPISVDYFGWLYGNYDNQATWELHRAELAEMSEYARSIDAELIVLIYPNMVDPVASIPYVDRVAQAIEESGQNNIIKLFDAVASWPAGTPLIVSNLDAHPSVEFNRYVAERLFADYFQQSP